MGDGKRRCTFEGAPRGRREQLIELASVGDARCGRLVERTAGGKCGAGESRWLCDTVLRQTPEDFGID